VSYATGTNTVSQAAIADLSDGGNIAQITVANSFADTQTFAREDAGTTNVTTNAIVQHTTTATPAAGIGAGFEYRVETLGGTHAGMRIDAVTTDVTDTAEDFDLVVRLMEAGAAHAERMRLTSAGNLTLSGTVDGRDLATDGSKLDGIEALADVTDATNVNAAGAIMHTDIGGNGMLARTAAETYVNRTITGTANEIVLADGDGVAGNPTIGIATEPTIPGTYMTIPTKADPDPTGADGRVFYNTTDNRFRFAIDTVWHDAVSPSTTDTLTNKSIDAANNTLTMTEAQLEAAVSDDNPVFDGDFGANGLCARTAAGTYTNRTITGTTGEITVTNGDGVSGNPTLSLSGMVETKSVTIGDGTNTIVATADATMFRIPYAITITDVHSHITGGTNVVFNIGHASTRTGTQLDVFTSDITLTSTAGQTNNTGFNDATVPADNWVWLEIVSVSGAVTMFHATIEYTRD
jgi:hypothetical protein